MKLLMIGGTVFLGRHTVEAALVTGVSVNLLTPSYNPQSGWTIGGRVRGLDSLPAAFEARPPYVVIDQMRQMQFPQLADYEQMVVRDYVRLYKRRETPAGASAPGSEIAPPESGGPATPVT